ncbi:uncharacterized protein I303_106283 [Kwoniella dejecticola CBS 10117]|uniref:Uncharacterized protein n=1 Tax=Kwoniella dejecticola CBS 10117 TaxID=1296121 RepID=A0A1A6A1T7_9TREE|nr:uncharacterized protein I303_06302 [Kwoniella dejecticola CBS 10117]OBR84015.1 hypothetical protein I303_06302 [Kwoniella dejecticola CBS 10117]
MLTQNLHRRKLPLPTLTSSIGIMLVVILLLPDFAHAAVNGTVFLSANNETYTELIPNVRQYGAVPRQFNLTQAGEGYQWFAWYGPHYFDDFNGTAFDGASWSQTCKVWADDGFEGTTNFTLEIPRQGIVQPKNESESAHIECLTPACLLPKNVKCENWYNIPVINSVSGLPPYNLTMFYKIEQGEAADHGTHNAPFSFSPSFVQTA